MNTTCETCTKRINATNRAENGTQCKKCFATENSIVKIALVTLSEGGVQAHKHNCADLKKRGKAMNGQTPWIMDVASKLDAFVAYNSDFIAEGGVDNGWKIEWMPCCPAIAETDPKSQAAIKELTAWMTDDVEDDAPVFVPEPEDDEDTDDLLAQLDAELADVEELDAEDEEILAQLLDETKTPRIIVDGVESDVVKFSDIVAEVTEAYLAETVAEEPVAKLTKTEAYEMVKRSREGLRDADEAIYRGTEEEAREALHRAIEHATKLIALMDARGGVNKLPKA